MQPAFGALAPGDPAKAGHYELLARLGAGGMGQVYLGRSPGGRYVAVKLVRVELAEDEAFRRRFTREVTAARRVSGPFTAAVIDADAEAERPWLATEYVPGLSLASAISSHGPWSADRVRSLGAGLAEALGVIHAAGVIHRDLKPENVLLSTEGPRVIDFGISRATDTSAITQTGAFMGTPGYMAPEQLLGEPVVPATDVFAFGAILAHVARGQGPFGTGPVTALIYRTVHEEPDLSGIEPALAAVISSCLVQDPADRPALPTLVERLAASTTDTLASPVWFPEPVANSLQAHASPPEVPLTLPPRSRPRTSRRRFLTLAGAGAAAGLAGGIVARRFIGDSGDPGDSDTGGLTNNPADPSAWTFTLPTGTAFDRVTTSDNALYASTTTGDVLALRPENGTTLWTYAAGNRAFLASTSEAVYLSIPGDSNRLRRLDSATGRQDWRVNEDVETDEVPPVVWRDSVFLLGADGLSTFDAATGERRDTDPGIQRLGGEPVLGRHPNGRPVIVIPTYIGGRASISVVFADDGGFAASATTDDTSTCGTPALANGMVYATTLNGLLLISDVRGGGQWNVGIGTESSPTCAVVGETLLVVDSGVLRTFTANGEPVRSYLPDGDALLDTLSATDDTAYALGESGTIYAIDPSGARERWTFQPSTETSAGPLSTPAHGHLYVWNDRTLHALSLATLDTLPPPV